MTKPVLIGKNKEMITKCPECDNEVTIRNKHVLRHTTLANGVLCDDCRQAKLANR